MTEVSAPADVMVLGAGIVGICVALHLQARGRNVVLVEKGEPGQQTSYGNAGLIERSTAFPPSFPQGFGALLRYASNTSPEARYAPLHLLRTGGRMARYWRNSRPDRLPARGRAFRALVALALAEHEALVEAAGLKHLIRHGGWLELLSAAQAGDIDRRIAEVARYGIEADRIDGAALAEMEPTLKRRFAAALHWKTTVGITDPGAYGRALAGLFTARGGRLVKETVTTLEQRGSQWQARAQSGATVAARDAVVTLGPWAPDLLGPLGYRVPMIFERGYHMHYALSDDKKLNHSVYIPGSGYLLSPMQKGVRLTTGVEFAARDARPNHAQLEKVETALHGLLPVARRLDDKPWMGVRPSTPDMLPLIGTAPRHEGLWFAFGHGHHGLTLGPVTGRLLADLMTGAAPCADPAPYRPDRFV